MAKKDNTAIAWAIGLGTLAAAGVGIVLYERSASAKGSTSSTTGSTLSPGTPVISACAKAAGLIVARNANPQDDAILKRSYIVQAAQCSAAGGTPPAWPT